MKFSEFNLKKEIYTAITEKGFEKASEIQEKAIPVIMEYKSDIIGIAQTGTGKTAAFGLPIIDKIAMNITHKKKSVKSIILAPTRELALQVASEMDSFKGNLDIKILTVYGGASITNQIKDLRQGVDIVVGTPGRILDLIKRRSLNIEDIESFVLDEADEMLKMGFIDDIETILRSSNESKKIYLFSATMPQKIKNLSKKYMKNQVIVEVAKKQMDTKLIEQHFYEINRGQKMAAMTKIIDVEEIFYGIIFCKTKMDVDNVTAKLRSLRYKVGCIHGDIAQAKREKVLDQFKKMQLNILVATDVAARGIDVSNLTHVINHSLPQESETYIHRIGRTGRAGNKGTAVSLIEKKDFGKLKAIEREHKVRLDKQTLPDDKVVKNRKIARFSEEVLEIITKANGKDYEELADKLIKEHDTKKIISSLLSKIGKETPKDLEVGSDDFEKKTYRNNDRNRDGGRSSSRGGYGNKSSGNGGGFKRSGYGGDRDRSSGNGGFKRNSYGDRSSSDGGFKRTGYGDRSSSSEGGYKKSSYGDRDKSSGNRSGGFKKNSYGDREGKSNSGGFKFKKSKY